MTAVLVALAWLGLTVQQTGYWRSDEALFEHNLEIRPDSPLANANMANVLFQRNELAPSEPYYRRAIEGRPNDYASILGLGRTLDLLGRQAEAENLYRQAIAQNRATPEVFNNLGTLHYQKQNYVEARALWQEAARREPHYMDPRYNLAQDAIREARFKDAKVWLEEAIRAAPDDARPRQRLEFVDAKLREEGAK